MTITALTYLPPVRRPIRTPKLDYELLETAVALADGGDTRAALEKVFAHLFPDRTIPDLATEPFSFVQGSSRVMVRIEPTAGGDEIAIAVPLVRLGAGGSAIAALRYVLTKIAGSGQLHNPRLRGDDIYLEYREKVSRLHPMKLLEVLNRMPYAADSHDDWIAGQFGAQLLERETIAPLDESELARVEEVWRTHWSEIDELARESQRKRSVFFLNELTAYAIYRLKFAVPLCGFLAARFAEAAGTFNNTDEDPTKREAALAKCVKEMKAVTAEELRANTGHVEYSISPFGEGTAQVVGEYFGPGNYMEQLDKLRTSAKPIDAAVALISTYNFLLARYAWPEDVETLFKEVLESVSGKPWREAANTLFEHAQTFAANVGEDDDEDEDEDEDDDEDDDCEDGDDSEDGDNSGNDEGSR